MDVYVLGARISKKPIDGALETASFDKFPADHHRGCVEGARREGTQA